MIQTFLFVAALSLQVFASSADHDGSIQTMSCFPQNSSSMDRAVFSFELPEAASELPVKGTLLLSSGIGNYGEHETTGVLPLAWNSRTAEGQVEYLAENESSQFRLVLDRAILGHVSRDVSVKLFLATKDGVTTGEADLRCYTSIYTAEDRRR